MKTMVFVLLALVIGLPAFGNLLINGGFETGDLTGWSIYAANDSVQHLNVQADSVKSGNYALNTQISSGVFGDFGVYQQVSVISGITYQINGYWAGTGNIYAWWHVFVFNGSFDVSQFADNPNHPEVIVSNVQASRDTWSSQSSQWEWESISNSWFNDQWYNTGVHTGQVVATGNMMTVVLRMGGGNGAAVSAYWDDFSLDPISTAPEPAPILALAVGLAGLVGLKRKR